MLNQPIFIPQNAEAFIGREAGQARYQHGSQTSKLTSFSRSTKSWRWATWLTGVLLRPDNRKSPQLIRYRGRQTTSCPSSAVNRVNGNSPLHVCRLQPARGELMPTLLDQRECACCHPQSALTNFTLHSGLGLHLRRLRQKRAAL